MLKDDIELLCGRIIDGPLTPALYLLLKDTKDMRKLCADLHIERSEEIDSTQGNDPQHGPLASGGLSLKDWLAHNAEPVTL